MDVSGIIALLDKHAPEPTALQRCGLTPARVREVAEAARPLTPEEIRREAVRAIGKLKCGSKGLPDYAIRQIWVDYQELGSCAKVGRLYGRTRQAIWEILKNHDCELRAKRFFKKVEYHGLWYTFGGSTKRHRYWRCTTGDRHLLQKRVWELANGPVPEGMEIAFRDGNSRNVDLANLECVPVTSTSKRRRADRKGKVAA